MLTIGQFFTNAAGFIAGEVRRVSWHKRMRIEIALHMGVTIHVSVQVAVDMSIRMEIRIHFAEKVHIERAETHQNPVEHHNPKQHGERKIHPADGLGEYFIHDEADWSLIRAERHL